MQEKLRLVGFVTAVPAIAVIVALFVARHYEGQWRVSVIENLGRELQQGEEVISLREFCSDPSRREGVEGLCSDLVILGWVGKAGWTTGIAGLVLIAAISLAGRLADRDRGLLLRVFRPGVYVTIFAVTGLALVHGILAISSIYYAEVTFLGRLHIGIMLAIAGGAAIGIYSMGQTVFALVHDATASVFGKQLPRETYPTIWKCVDDIARQVGSQAPEHLVAGLDATYFVTEASVTCLDGILKGRTLYLSLPLCRILSQGEVAAVIGHEMGHFKGEDTLYSQRFYPIYRGASDALLAIAETAEGARSISLLPAISVLSHFLEAFSVAEKKLGRERELAADQVGARVGSGKDLASALVKLHAFTEEWDAATAEFSKAASGAQPFPNVCALFADRVHEASNRSTLDKIDENRLPHPTDTHPSLNVRLVALSVTLDEVAEQALQTSLITPSSQVIDSYQELESALTGHLREVYIRQSNQIEPPKFGLIEP